MPFTKGHKIVGNRNGRPKGAKNKISQRLFEEFLDTLKEVEEERKADNRINKESKTLFKHIISRGFKSDTVGLAVLRKLVPDRIFSIEDLQNANIKVTFEIIEAKKGRKVDKDEEH